MFDNDYSDNYDPYLLNSMDSNNTELIKRSNSTKKMTSPFEFEPPLKCSHLLIPTNINIESALNCSELFPLYLPKKFYDSIPEVQNNVLNNGTSNLIHLVDDAHNDYIKSTPSSLPVKQKIVVDLLFF
jgi:hypothetical protein